MAKTYFLSDLHLFTRRSLADAHCEAIYAAARDARALVLGGDIFDFHWSIHKEIETSLSAAAGWLTELIAHAPDCQFHFLMGNHDHHPLFMRRLNRLVKEHPNFAWEPFYLRMGDAVFLHGDVADRQMNPRQLSRARTRSAGKRRKSKAWHHLYDMAVHTRLHSVVGAIANRPKRVARRIHSYLQTVGQGPDDGVRNVYFGHTHVPLADYEFGGLTFHNGGAPMKGLRFRILEAQVSGVDWHEPGS